MYDLCVVGAGMIGSAAARHASAKSGIKVCLIGPSEPKTKSPSSPRDIFGCHYDEGRITRLSDPDSVWAHLAKESIKRYRDIERKSGISFYKVVGGLMVGSQKSDYLQNVRNTAQEHNIEIQELNRKELADKFPYLNLDENAQGLFEKDNAGHISPRKLVEAQKVNASRQGCEVIDDVVKSVTRAPHTDGSYIMKVVTEGGRTLDCKAVLIATGAFTNFRNLLPGIRPKQTLYGLTVALVEVNKEYLGKLKDMPVVICNSHPRQDRSNRHQKVSFYLLPPIQYPDGRFYLKLGIFHESHPVALISAAEVREWFLRGDSRVAESTANLIASLFKGLELKSWHGDYCVVMGTPTVRPYIDTVHAQLGVAVGGNGYAAKSSDEIGRIASEMMMSKWSSKLPRDVFKLDLDEGSVSNKTSNCQSKL